MMNQLSRMIADHYDQLIDDGNDPVLDDQPLRDYMDRWDGAAFYRALTLSKEKSVLEIGVGTGRIALKLAPHCKRFCGIDLSPKTVERAAQHLHSFPNCRLICSDFLEYSFATTFDLIYSTLTWFHVKEKRKALERVASLLSPDGHFVLSIEKEKRTKLIYNTRSLPLFPDDLEETKSLLLHTSLRLVHTWETDFAYILLAEKL